jgi:hypothetical protein
MFSHNVRTFCPIRKQEEAQRKLDYLLQGNAKAAPDADKVVLNIFTLNSKQQEQTSVKSYAVSLSASTNPSSEPIAVFKAVLSGNGRRKIQQAIRKIIGGNFERGKDFTALAHYSRATSWLTLEDLVVA